MTYDIFISYKRREISSAVAALMYNYLSQKGYKVFFDRKEIRQGRFNEQLYNHIEGAKDIIILLEDTSLKACFNEQVPDAYKTDWFCKEIMHALEMERDKHIIPVLLSGYRMPEPDDLPEEMRLLPLQNAIPMEASEMDEVFQKYFIKQGYLLSSPGNPALLRMPGAADTSESISDFLFCTSSDCDIYECGEKVLSLTSDCDGEHPYRYGVRRSGEHRFRCRNNDTCEEQIIAASVDAGAQKYIEIGWKSTQNLWRLTDGMILAEDDPSVLYQWGCGLFWGTSTHAPDLDLAYRCLCRAVELGDERAKGVFVDDYVALFDRDLPDGALLPWLQKAADLGSLKAKLSMAGYFFGKDDRRAVGICTEVAEAGDDGAMLLLGRAYLYGDHGEPVDRERAEMWLRRAVEAGSTEAMCELGAAYEYGAVLREDEEAAAALYRRAVDAGSKKALTMLGNCYRDGVGVAADKEKAVELYKRAVERRGSLDEVDPWSEYIMGLCYSNGTGVEKDDSKALEWFYRAARQGDGDAGAMSQIGRCHYLGLSTPQNYRQAFDWFSRAADKGDADALSFLAIMYKHGEYVERDKDRALSLYRQAYEKNGNPAAAYQIAVMISHDSPEESFRYLTYGAENGYPPAQLAMGEAYLRGLSGVERDDAAAYEWLCLSARGGDEEAMYHLASHYYADGCLFANGDRIEADPQRAFELFLESAEKGYPESMYKTSTCYLLGNGVKQDYAAAYGWLKEAAKRGVEWAFRDLIYISDSHPECCPPDESALYWSCRLIERGCHDIDFVFGRYDKPSEEEISALGRSLGIAAEKGFLAAKRHLAEWHLRGVLHSDTPPLSLYEEVAGAGDNEARYQLALYYLQRHWPLHRYMTAYDPKKAAGLLEQAAADGHTHSKYKLAELYARGVGVGRDAARAVSLLDDPGVAGMKEADRLLAGLYPGDLKEWFREMKLDRLVSFALSGVEEACLEMSGRYSSGADGLKPDERMAEYWRNRTSAKVRQPVSSVLSAKLNEPQKWLWQK